jgi:hypothetical protein
MTHLGITAEIADQDYLVDATGHRLPTFSWRGFT